MTIQFKKVLAFSPHTDDMEIGCGGLICKLAMAGAEIVLCVATALEDRQAEAMAAKRILGIKKLIYMNYPIRSLPFHRQAVLDKMMGLRTKVSPDLVLVPASTDTHQDHRVVSEEAYRAFKDTTIWGYEIAWNNPDFPAQCFVGLSGKHLERKIRAVKCYDPSQTARLKKLGRKVYPPEDYIRALAMSRGLQSRIYDFAECFQVVRQCV